MPRQKNQARHLSELPLHSGPGDGMNDRSSVKATPNTLLHGATPSRSLLSSTPGSVMSGHSAVTTSVLPTMRDQLGLNDFVDDLFEEQLHPVQSSAKTTKGKKSKKKKSSMVVDAAAPESSTHSFLGNSWRQVLGVKEEELSPVLSAVPSAQSRYAQIGYVTVDCQALTGEQQQLTLWWHRKSSSLVLRVGASVIIQRDLTAGLVNQLAACEVVLIASLTNNSLVTDYGMMIFINVFVVVDRPLPVEVVSFAVCNMLACDRPTWLDLENCWRDTLFDENDMFEFNSTVISNSHSIVDGSSSASEATMCADLRRAGLLTVLRNYQARGVAWLQDMLFVVERKVVEAENEDNFFGTDGYLPLRLIGGRSSSSSSSGGGMPCWYHVITGELCLLPHPPLRRLPSSVLLCDHMGVGKTLQILSLVLLRKALDGAACGDGHVSGDSFVSGIGGRYPSIVSSSDASLESSSCFCGSSKRFNKQEHLFLLRCTACSRVCHASCAGYDTSAEADCASPCEGAGGVQYCIDPSKYVCLPCVCAHTYDNKLPTRATCILVPDTLVAQWGGEIKKHFASRSLRVKVYESVLTLGALAKSKNYSRIGGMSPLALTEYDIILVGISLFSREYHVANHHIDKRMSSRVEQRSAAGPHLHSYFPPPILCLSFRLLVVDETQKLDAPTGTSHILELARRLSSERRLCVSGTPLKNSSLGDLQSLCQFLQVHPLDDVQLWRSLFRPFLHRSLPVAVRFHVKILSDIFRHIMLRRTKGMIAEQLGLVRKLVLVRSLKFTPFENALYLEYEAECRRKYSQGSDESRLELYKQLLQDLRIGCCHPSLFDRTMQRSVQGRRRGVASALAARGGVDPQHSRARPISEIMILKIENAKLLTEEKQRALLLCLSGMAAQAALMAKVVQPFLVESTGGSAADAQVAVSGYYLKAILCYLSALAIFSSNRQLALLATLAEVRGDPFFVGDDGSVREMPTTSPISLAWLIRPSATSKRRRTGGDGSGGAGGVIWLPLPSRHVLPPGSSSDDDDDDEGSIGFSALTGAAEQLSCRLGFKNNKRILEMTLRQKFHSVLKRIELELGTDDEETDGAVHAIVFPRRVALRALTGETPETVHSVDLPLPVSSRTNTASFVNWVRRRVYSVDVESAHQQALLLTRAHGGGLLYRWQDLRHVDPPELSSLHLHVSIDASFRDAAVEPDLFQELHVLHNLLDCALTDGASEAAETAMRRHASPAGISVEDLRLPAVDAAAASPPAADSSSSQPLLVELRARRDYIVSQHLGGVTGRHTLSQLKVRERSEKVAEAASELRQLADAAGMRGLPTTHAFLSAALPLVYDRDDFTDGLVDIVDRGEMAYVRFRRPCQSAGSLLLLVAAEADELHAARDAALLSVRSYVDLFRLSRAQKDEARDCRVCRSYLDKRGRRCFHCERRSVLDAYQAKVTGFRNSRDLLTSAVVDGDGGEGEGGEEGVRRFESMQVDCPMLMLARYVRRCLPRLGDAILSRRLAEIADAEILRLTRLAEESRALFSSWRAYQDLLKGHDDIEQCQYRLGIEAFPAHEDILPAYQFSFAQLAAAKQDLQGAASKVTFFSEQERLYRLQRQQSLRADHGGVTDMADGGVADMAASDSEGEDVAEAAGSECKVCLLEMFAGDEHITHLMCGHYFHAECISSWLQMKLNCPLCKQRVLRKELITVSPKRERELQRRGARPQAQSHDITDMLDSEGGAENSSSSSRKESRVVMLANAPSAPPGTWRTSCISGEYGSKIEAVVGDIMELFGADPRPGETAARQGDGEDPDSSVDKVIVFSQWPDMLLIVQDALETNGLRCVLCREARDFATRNSPLEKFLSTATYNILLLPLRLGADGLDLSAANHIFLLEPILSPSVEMQAVNRIDRLGQRKTPYIHKYFFSGSVEERIVGRQLQADVGGSGDDTFLDARGRVAFAGGAATKRDDDQLSFRDLADLVVGAAEP